MRKVLLHEKNKRGCAYCMDAERTKKGKGYSFSCPHTQCQYHVLDKYDSYEEFMASDDAKIPVNGFFQTSASCYELSNGNAKTKQACREGEFIRFW